MRFLLAIILAFAVSLSCIHAQDEFKVKGYDSHVELNWNQDEEVDLYRIYVASSKGGEFQLRGETRDDYYLDFVTDIGRNIKLSYKLVPVVDGNEQKPIGSLSASVRDFTDEELLEMVQRYTFRYFWDFGEPNTGLSHERTKSK